MTRKAIPETTQTSILLKSRRRCCLCFWLKGEDEVKKGQIAHLDQNHENDAEDNLAFMCMDHHDDYDSTTRLSKGLREDEVRRWRNELYKEMEYRFRLLKTRSLALQLTGLTPMKGGEGYMPEFQLTNTGDADVRSPTVSFRRLKGMAARPPNHQVILVLKEWKADFFEPNGDVVLVRLMAVANPILLRGHAAPFKVLYFPLSAFPPGTVVPLEYRLDGEDMAPVTGRIDITIPGSAAEAAAPA
jgi:hypothetical protein